MCAGPEELVKKDCYQVFLFTCPATMWLGFARHPWFVVNKMGEISRWEVLMLPNQSPISWRHLHKNWRAPFESLGILHGAHSWTFKPTLVKVIEGDENSVAARMIEAIEKSPQTYTNTDRYRLTGPNSNTYAQWAIGQFPECGMTLPWNAVGKNYGK